MPSQLEDLLRACTVRVAGGPMPGAGFFVAPSQVMTCVHVIGDSADLVVRWERDGQLPLEAAVSERIAVLNDRGRPIPALEPYPDIAVLKVDGFEGHPCVGVDLDWPAPTDRFQVFGYPKEGGAVQLTPARLTYRGVHGIEPTAYLELASDTIRPGMSGAAVLNLRSGRVCGVVVASKDPAHPDGALAVSWSVIKMDLSQVLVANRAFHLQDGGWEAAVANRERRRPGQEHRNVVVYLRTLIDWLSIDPWPRDRRFGGPALSPAAIERKLRVAIAGTEPDREGERDLDADELAKQCRRLVVLGGPGSGKTWLAKRAARRCAEDALKFLAIGGNVDEVELPLYITCSHLFSAVGDIRQAAVSSALDHLGDLGSPRLSAELFTFFTERNAPTVLVIDSLDEAHGSDERLRQADTLPWRILLTSRPSSWSHQLVMEEGNDSCRVGELQPLRYPEDVEPFIQRWFEQRPECARDLAGQIARHSNLRQLATVPLILAFYCIVAGSEPLPNFRRDLYKRVLNRMLTGRWRRSNDHQPDVDTCILTLRGWAWSGATSDPVSGVGKWADEVPTGRVQLSEADEDAVEHVAMSLDPADLDTGKTFRRFIHWSVREHLVAEHVAGLEVDDAAKALLPHVWFDFDWEHAAAAAIAMHPQRGQLLRNLICLAAHSDQIPEDLAVIDAGWEFRRLLARIASESSEADWSPEMSRIIGQARVELALSGHTSYLAEAASWGTSSRRACEALLEMLASQRGGFATGELVRGVVELASTIEDKRQAREALLRMLASQRGGFATGELVRGVVELASTTEDKRQAREALLRMLASQRGGFATGELVRGVVELASTTEDKRQAREALSRMLASQRGGFATGELVRGVVELASTSEDRHRAREALSGVLASQSFGWAVEELISGVVELARTTEDKRQACEVLLEVIARRATPSRIHPQGVEDLVSGVVQLASTAEDKRQARETLLRLLPGPVGVGVAAHLVAGAIQLAFTTEDKSQAREALLESLASHINNRPGKELMYGAAEESAEDERPVKYRLPSLSVLMTIWWTHDWPVEELIAGVVQLASTAEEQRRVREVLLGLLADQTNEWVAARLAGGVVQLAPTAEEQRRVREVLLCLLADQTDEWVAARLVDGVVQLAPTAEEQRRARNVLLRLLADPTDSRAIRTTPRPEDTRRACDALLGLLTNSHDQLNSAVTKKRQARDAVLRVLANETDSQVAMRLASLLLRLAPTAQDRHRARDAMLNLLDSQNDYEVAAKLVDGVVRLAATARDRHQARDAMLNLLDSQNDYEVAAKLVDGVVRLAATARDRHQARDAMLNLLDSQNNHEVAAKLVDGVVRLAATARDRHQARDAMLNLLNSQNRHEVAEELLQGLVEVASTMEEQRWTRKVLLGLLADQTDEWVAAKLVDGVVRLAATAQDRHQARDALLSLLDSQNNREVAARLVDGVVRLAATAQDRHQARDWLLSLLDGQNNGAAAAALLSGMLQLDPTAEDRRQARERLLSLLDSQNNGEVAEELVAILVWLEPNVRDLITWRAWAAQPTEALLAMARMNSALGEWLEALPSLPSPAAPTRMIYMLPSNHAGFARD